MQTIIIVLDPGKLVNADLDLRYRVPERIDELSGGVIQDNGYDYIECGEGGAPLLGLWLKTEAAKESWGMIAKIFREEVFLDNNLALSAKIYISENDVESLENCRLVYPE